MTDVVLRKDLKDLYVELDITDVMVENAEYGETDLQLRGRSVLKEWRKQRPGEATKRAILEGLEKRRNLEATRALIEMWT